MLVIKPLSEIFLTLFPDRLTLLKSPIYIKLNSINDFARLVCSLERIPIPIFEYDYKNENVFAVNFDSINGKPLIYYVNNTTSKENQYLSYKIHRNHEEVTLVDSIKDSSVIYSPIIKIFNMPPSFLKSTKVSSTCQYLSIGLKDISSLSKLVAYQSILGDSSTPLFLFSTEKLHNTKPNHVEKKYHYVIGTSLNIITDSGDSNYFYYVLLDHNIDKYFVKFNTQKSSKPSYVNNIDEHGYNYLKIIKLDSIHPLVKI